MYIFNIILLDFNINNNISFIYSSYDVHPYYLTDYLWSYVMYALLAVCGWLTLMADSGWGINLWFEAYIKHSSLFCFYFHRRVIFKSINFLPSSPLAPWSTLGWTIHWLTISHVELYRSVHLIVVLLRGNESVFLICHFGKASCWVIDPVELWNKSCRF